MAKQVFLSYSTDDTSVATAVRDHLEAQGVACWMAPRDITPGKDYGEQIINAIEEATVFLLILSESSNASTFVRHEVERAVSKGKVIIPFRIQPVQPSRSLEFFISNYQWIDGWELPAVKSWEALVLAIRSYLYGQPVQPLVSQAPLQPAAEHPPHNLPHQLTSFIGRKTELAALDELLSRRDVRLITILGAGGMGKTRLALAAAQGHLSDPHFSDGVYFVALAPLSDPQHIVLTLAEVLSVSLLPSDATHTPQQQLIEYLRSKRMLLLFDNFEHLLHGAEFIAQILHAAPQVRVLATSRERLRLLGEHLFPIQGLEYDKVGSTNSAPPTAVQLFLQSARELQPNLNLFADDLAHIASICRLVGGMPLGIELAASWIEVLSPAEIMAEIQRSLDFLEAERRGGSEHHRSMRAVFDSTWQRLDPSEQTLFARLAIFRGGFTREAAEQITAASLRLLSTLAGKSLIQHEHGRYTLHEQLRQFAEEKLLAVPQIADETYARLCTYYTTFLQRQEDRLKGQEYAAAMSAIELELENIRTAWQWGIAHHQAEHIDRGVEALWIFFYYKLWLQEGAAFFGSTAAALRMDEPAGKQGILLARLLAIQAWFLAEQGFHMGSGDFWDKAQALYLQSLEIFGKLGVPGEIGDTLLGLSVLSFMSGNGEQADVYGQKALTLFTERHDLWKMSFILPYRGSLLKWMGKYQQAIQCFRQAVAISEQCGYLSTLGNNLYELGDALKVVRETEEAQRVAEKCLEVNSAVGNRYGISLAYSLLGELALQTGDFLAAQQHVEVSLALIQEMGLTRTQDFSLVTLGWVACSLGDLRRARFYFYPILKAYLKAAPSTLTWAVGEAATGMATVLANAGKATQAMELLTAVLHNEDGWQDTKDRATKLLAELLPETPSQDATPARSLNVVISELLNE